MTFDTSSHRCVCNLGLRQSQAAMQCIVGTASKLATCSKQTLERWPMRRDYIYKLRLRRLTSYAAEIPLVIQF